MVISPVTLNGDFSAKPTLLNVVDRFLTLHPVDGLKTPDGKDAPIGVVLDNVRINPDRKAALKLHVYNQIVPGGSPDPNRSYRIKQEVLAGYIKGFLGKENPYSAGNVEVGGPKQPQAASPQTPQTIKEASEAVAVNDETTEPQGPGYIAHTKIGGVPNEILASIALLNEVFPNANIAPLTKRYITEVTHIYAA